MKHTKCYKKGYPRPQLVRKSWDSLNGLWDFRFDPKNIGEREGWQKGFDSGDKINVPFAYEAPLSGIGKADMVPNVWYCKRIKLGKAQLTPVIKLIFEGSDYITKVYVNGSYVGLNEGAYHRFSFDIAPYAAAGENVIVVKAEDSYACDRPRGKQRWQDGVYACWYVQTTGIYKSVWMEYLDTYHLESLRMTPSLKDDSVGFYLSPAAPSDELSAEIKIEFGGRLVKTTSCSLNEYENYVRVDIGSAAVDEHTAYWSPARPCLYDVEITLSHRGVPCDGVASYFGMREIGVQGDKVVLNRAPVVQALLLDQGHWEDGHLTPPDEAALQKDIELMKSAGFNGARKHQKIEDERFLYYADILGFFVWCEMPSMFRFSERSSARFIEQWQKIVRQNANHPSVVCWVPFNESWGVRMIETNERQQSLANAAYYVAKALDGTRPVVSNDGWEHTTSDIVTIHHYTQKADELYDYYKDPETLEKGHPKNGQKKPFAKGYGYRGEPVMISEFGGAAFNAETDKGWGYGRGVDNAAELVERVRGMITAVGAIGSGAGFCYTQFTDVQQEINGLFTANRQPKADIKELRQAVKSYLE
ncbi:MAG: glycoside hydrolase family 2 [Clostridiales bacterium]|jgi:beta-galactosidase/beta-glucuronidase|nr:glycoside hydrolase family 2 [Clostridiales bacterium]